MTEVAAQLANEVGVSHALVVTTGPIAPLLLHPGPLSCFWSPVSPSVPALPVETQPQTGPQSSFFGFSVRSFRLHATCLPH